MKLYLPIILLCVAVQICAVPLIEHNGAADPTTEGWSLVNQGGSPLTLFGPVTNDQGFDSWNMDNRTHSTSGDLLQVRALNTTEVNDALTNGWALKVVARVIQASHSIVRFSTGNRLFEINLLTVGDTLNGDPMVVLGGNSVTLTGEAGNYHEYLLIDEDADGAADLYIDGQLAISGYTGASHNFIQRISFGDNGGSTTNNFNINYNHVSFEISPTLATVPETSSLALLLVALGLLASRRKFSCKH